MESLAGKLLVASPRLGDPNFRRSVVLVVHHGREGAFGLVLNRPGAERLAAIWEQAVHRSCPLDQALFIGGPVEGPIVAIHADPTRSEDEVVAGVHFTRQKDHLVELVAAASVPLRVFAGYSGWGRGQLEGEIDRGDWSVAEATADVVFGDESTLWATISRRVADEALALALRIRHVPLRPWHN